MDGRILQVNGKDQIVQKGNYNYSSLRVTSIDVKESKNSQRKTSVTQNQILHRNRIALHAVKWKEGSADSGSSHRKSNYRAQTQCIYIYIYVYIYLYIYLYAYIYIYICVCVYKYIYMYVYLYVYIQVYVYKSIYMYVYICVYMYTYMRKYV